MSVQSVSTEELFNENDHLILFDSARAILVECGEDLIESFIGGPHGIDSPHIDGFFFGRRQFTMWFADCDKLDQCKALLFMPLIGSS